MRVDLTARYKEVREFLQPRPQIDQKPQSPISDFLPQLAESSNVLGAREPQAAQIREPVARYTFEPPKLKGTEPQIILPEAPAEVKPSVKTPSEVQARRIEENNSFDKLSRNDRMDAVQNMARQFGEKIGIDPLLGMAVVENESSFKTKAVSEDGHASKGLFQLLDSTGKELHGKEGEGYDPFHPETNVELGLTYLRKLHDVFSEATELREGVFTVPSKDTSSLEHTAVAAFNAGEGRVANAQKRAKEAGKDPSLYDQIAPFLPPSTQSYVEKVFASRETLSTRFGNEL